MRKICRVTLTQDEIATLEDVPNKGKHSAQKRKRAQALLHAHNSWLDAKEYRIPPEGNAEFAAAMEDVPDVYERPEAMARPLVCMDECPKQLIGETRTPIPAEPGMPERFDTEYVRNGTCDLFMFTAPLVGWRRAEVTERRTQVDWAHQIRRLVDEDFPNAKKIVLVMDNLNTHRPASLYEAFEPAEAKRIWDRLEIHYTPSMAVG